jgi:DNA polymerase-4
MFKALRVCPTAVVIKPNFAKYRLESRRILDRLRTLTPLVQPLSLDEAWLDLAGTERLNEGPPALALAKMQTAIERETGLTVSIGLGPNKFLAKIASDLDKPGGFCVIGSQEATAFLAPRSVSLLPGVGPSMAKALEAAGLRRVGDIAKSDLRWLVDRFGAQGLRLSRMAAGEDFRPVAPLETAKSISAETTFAEDIADRSGLEDQLWPLCEKVAFRARRSETTGRVATLKLKTSDFRSLTRRRTLPAPTQTARTLFAALRPLLEEETRSHRRFRLIGAGLSGLAAGSEEDAVLFADVERRARRTESAIDRLRDRFGEEAVVTGRALRSLSAARPAAGSEDEG